MGWPEMARQARGGRLACVADRCTYMGALPRSANASLTGSAVYFGYIGEAERLDRAVGPQA